MPLLFATIINPVSKVSVRGYLLLDSGASHSTIPESIAFDQLHLPSSLSSLRTVWRFGSKSPDYLSMKLVSLFIQFNNNSSLTLNVWTHPSPQLSLQQPDNIPSSILNKLNDYGATQVSSNPISIIIIIGVDVLNQILFHPSSQHFVIKGSLFVHRTPYGTFSSGDYNSTSSFSSPSCTSIQLFSISKESADRFWSLETLGIDGNELHRESQQLLDEQFLNTTCILPCGRIQVRLPYKSSFPIIESNYDIALSRLISTHRQLSRKGVTILDQYHQIFQKQLNNKQIEIVSHPEQHDGSVLHYLSHFPVFRADSQHTKVRIVLNPAALTKTKKSLNSLLHTGPNLLTDLIHMLIRFRMSCNVLIADLESAFLNISVHPMDRDALRFLWLKDPSKAPNPNNIIIYRYTRVCFGVNSSPYLLLRSLQYLFHHYPSSLSSRLKDSIYMDNIILPVHPEEDIYTLYHEIKTLFQQARMNCREFGSNLSQLYNSIPEEDKGGSQQMKVLGLFWNMETDTISIKHSVSNPSITTMRQLLKELMLIYDPLSLFAPITIQLKMMYQQLHQRHQQFDDPIPHDLLSQWNELYPYLSQIPSITIPRFSGIHLTDSFHLVGFCDASLEAYGCVIYAVPSSSTGVLPFMLFAKSRVKPLKQSLTIPRMELLALLCGTRALTFVESSFSFSFEKVYLYSDSTIALYQVLNNKDHKLWVNNRCLEIRQKKNLHLSYVDTKSNPADLATKSIPPKRAFELCSDSLWKHGPSWLSTSQWPTLIPLPDPNHSMESSNSSQQSSPIPAQSSLQCTNQQQEPTIIYPFGINPSKFSSLNRLFNITKFCWLFLSKLRKVESQSHQYLINKVRISWIQASQQVHFSDILTCLQQKANHQTISQLSLFLDDDKIIRVGTRLTKSNLPYGTIFPILLHRQCPLVKLILLDLHHQFLHVGPRQLLSLFRKKYYSPKIFQFIKSLCYNCTTCRRLNAGPFLSPSFGPLPAERSSPSRPFQFIGFDTAGPLKIKIPHDSTFIYQVRHIGLFVCQSIRALHIELLTDLTASTVIHAFERFISRRGVPTLVVHDNHPSLLSTASLFSSYYSNSSRSISDSWIQFYHQYPIKFQSIPERTPHYGGFYERFVRLIKSPLIKTIGQQIITEDHLYTLLIKIEGIINSRPLVQYSIDEPSSTPILTPFHFLAPGASVYDASTSTYDPEDEDYEPSASLESSLIKMKKKLDHKVSIYWKHFLDDYLLSLQNMYKNHHHQHHPINRLPKVNEIVLIKSPTKRHLWPIAKVTELLYSTDGSCRFVRLLLPSKTITRRAVKDLIPLEGKLTTDIPTSIPNKQNDQQSHQQSTSASSTSTSSNKNNNNKNNNNKKIHTMVLRSDKQFSFLLE